MLSIYGMSATDPIHQKIIYEGGGFSHTSYDTMTKDQIEKKLKDAPFPYQWGVCEKPPPSYIIF